MKKISIAINIALILVFALNFTACPNDVSEKIDRNKLYAITIDPGSAEGNPSNGYISADKDFATYGTEVKVYYVILEEGYTVNAITYNGKKTVPGLGYYYFQMPNKDVTIQLSTRPGGFDLSYSKVIYKGGQKDVTNLTFINEQNIFDRNEDRYDPVMCISPLPDTVPNIVTEEDDAGRGDGVTGSGKAIKLDFDSSGAEIYGTTNKDWYALRLNFDQIDLGESDALSFYIRTTYDDYYSLTDRKPAVHRVVFGDEYSPVKQEWTGFSVQYEGEPSPGGSLNSPRIPVDATYTDDDLVRRNRWTRIIVPIPKLNQKCKNIMLYFLPWQVIPMTGGRELTYYIDQIEFIKIMSTYYSEDKYLESVILPARANMPGGKVGVDINMLTQDTIVRYRLDNIRYTLYGREQRPGSEKFTNKLDQLFDVKYFPGSGLSITGGKISASDYNKRISLYATYDGVRSLVSNATMINDGYEGIKGNMQITVLTRTVTPPANNDVFMLQDFQSLLHPNDYGGLVRLPLYWGGTAGDAQCYKDEAEGNRWILNCYMKNIAKDTYFESGDWTGFIQDDWYIFGGMGFNHNLSNKTKIVIRAKIVPNSVWEFALESGFIGVEGTVTEKNKRKEHKVKFTGQGYQWQNYEFPLQQFWDNGIDKTMVTGFNVFTRKAFNDSTAAIAGWTEFDTQKISAGIKMHSIWVE